MQVEDFPVFLKTENLLMHGAVKEVDPRNLKDTVDMDVFLFEDYIVLAVCNELREIRYSQKKTQTYSFLNYSHVFMTCSCTVTSDF